MADTGPLERIVMHLLPHRSGLAVADAPRKLYAALSTRKRDFSNAVCLRDGIGRAKIRIPGRLDMNCAASLEKAYYFVGWRGAAILPR